MKIEIKNRFTGSIILSGEYKSIKDCLEKNKGADLVDADLRGADLRGADLVGADLRGAYLVGADLRGADLRGADLVGAYLVGAYLVGADLRGAYLVGADLRGAYLVGADLRGAYLVGAYLVGADLVGADLVGAYLVGAYLVGAYLRDAKNYLNSHDMFAEAIRRQKVTLFVQAEWVAIAQIIIHRLCWDAIKKRFSKVMPSIFKKLAKAGFTEWLEYWNEMK